jgi:Gram-negative bacterial TonB protein C-terminal
MKRSLLPLALAVLALPSCRTAGPKGPPGPPVPPDLLRPYVDQVWLLRHRGDEKVLTLKAGERPSGECDTAVYVRSADVQKGAARFSLETVGLARARGHVTSCHKLRPGLQLVVAGFPAEAAPVSARMDAVLLAPEAYLKTKGLAFDRPAGEKPKEVASRESFSTPEEKRLGRHVSKWPEVVLAVDPWYHDPSGRVHQEGEVELDAVVGTDGRIYDPKLRTSLGTAHEQAVLRTLPLWRLEPARRGETPVAARVALQPILHID